MAIPETPGRLRASEEAELVEAELVTPVEDSSRADGAIDAVFDAAERVIAPIARLGYRGARGLGRRLGIDRAVGRAVDRGVDRALETDAAERAVERALQSEGVQRAWDKVLESEEAQKLVERVAEAPEVRKAITAQGVGLLEDVRGSARKAARRLDDIADDVACRLLRRPRRTARPPYAGVATRGFALLFDALVLNGILLLISTLLALLINNVFSLEGDATAITIAFGAIAWWVAAGLYLAGFWILAERTPGMTFFGLRILGEDRTPVPPGQDIRRLIWFPISLLPFGLGFLGILTEDRRRGWPDRRARTLVFYADPEIDPGVGRAGRPARTAS
jgi:uncharacterized RDD family membrane protein YckC